MRTALKYPLLLCVLILALVQVNARNTGNLSKLEEKMEVGQKRTGTLHSKLQGELSLKRRVLQSGCSSYSSCSECSSDTTCAYLNGECTQNPGYSIINEGYNQADEYIYCTNALATGYISQDNIRGNILELSKADGATAASHSLCEWNIRVDNQKGVTIEISRDAQHYEEIYVQANSNSTYKYYSSAGLTTCSGENIVLNLSGVSHIKVRVKILNDSSNYTVKISQEGVKEESIVFLICFILGACLLCYCFCCCSMGIGVCAGKLATRKVKISLEVILQNRTRLIEQALDAMLEDYFCNLNLDFDQKSCVICLGDFTDMDRVCVTNECDHSFHPDCLKKWFENIVVSKHIFCPICTIDITSIEQKKRLVPLRKMNSMNSSVETRTCRKRRALVLRNTLRISPSPFTSTMTSMVPISNIYRTNDSE